jgi:hypothetical protein
MIQQDYQLLSGAVPDEICKLCAIQYELQESCCKTIYPGIDMSDLSPNSFARYAPLCFEALSVYLLPAIENAIGEKLYPVYSYARIYYTGSRLDPHFDRSSSEISVSVCIEKDPEKWPLFIKSEQGITHEINLNQGDIVIYKGNSQEHWRNEFTGRKQIQCFLQYVRVDGPASWLKWDTRPSLGLPYDYVGPAVKAEVEQVMARDKLSANS